MTKSEFRAKSAKKLLITCVILLISNILTGFNSELAQRNTRLANSASAVAIFALIAASVLTALAVRTERRWVRRFDGKKYLKAGTLLCAFIAATVIISLLRIRLSLNMTDAVTPVWGVIYNATTPFSVVFSFGVFVGLMALFYALSAESEIFFKVLCFVTVLLSGVNMLLRLIYGVSSVYIPDAAILRSPLMNGYLRTILSVSVYTLGVVMFVWARGLFLRAASIETEPYNKIYIKENGKQRALRAGIAPPPPEGYGIDAEDELIAESEDAETIDADEDNVQSLEAETIDAEENSEPLDKESTEN